MNRLLILFRQLLKPLDLLLDKITSYKLVLYFLVALIGWSVMGDFFGEAPYPAYRILASAVWLVIVCRGINLLLAKQLNIPKNNESDLITALILALILTPPDSLVGFMEIGVVASIAMLTKYLLVINRWHIFNPAATAAFTAGLIFNSPASWWVGTKFITPIVLIGGFLVLRKMKRFTMALIFILVALGAAALQTYLNQSSEFVDNVIWAILSSTALLFFASVMLTEPLTSPKNIQNYAPYAMLVGFLYGYTKLGISPEEALLIGNIFAYLFEPNKRIELKFKKKRREANGIESFIFTGKKNFKYRAGQYMEWTIENNKSDARGNRRYLTISSSPTEKDLMFTVRVPESSASSFKNQLEKFEPEQPILAAQLSGTFTLPRSEKQKLAFLAGGVGITPFRSMIKYAVDFEQQRDIYLLYSASKENQFAFRDLFSEAENFGIKTSYTTEIIDTNKIEELIPDFKDRTFYISGPYGFVSSMEKNLLKLGLSPGQIKIDYFPGYGG